MTDYDYLVIMAVHPLDHELMQRVAAGDRRAQRALAVRVVHRVRRAAAALMRGSSEAEDAAQYALIEVLRSAHTYRGDSSLERWSDRVSGRAIIRFARRSRRHRADVDAAPDPDLLRAELPSESIADSVPRPISEYLSLLSPVRRETLVLKHALGHSVNEIAAMRGVSPNTVKDHLHAGRSKIRSMARRDLMLGVRRELCV